MMDVAAAQIDAHHVKDEVAELCQKKFQDFLEEWRDEGDTQPKYLEPAKELVEKPQRNTLQVSMRDIQVHNEQLSETITREYYRVYPYLCAAIKNFVKDHVDSTDKDLYLSIIDVDIVHKVRNVNAEVSSYLTEHSHASSILLMTSYVHYLFLLKSLPPRSESCPPSRSGP